MLYDDVSLVSPLRCDFLCQVLKGLRPHHYRSVLFYARANPQTKKDFLSRWGTKNSKLTPLSFLEHYI